MRETQFYICLAVTLGLLLLVIPAIFLLGKRLPTIQKKIFFAQVWFASMVVVLIPLYYHFYKVAVYYSVSVLLLAFTVIGSAIIYYKSNISNNPDIAYFQSFITLGLFLLGFCFLFTNSVLSYVYLFNFSLGNDHIYGFGANFFYTLILTLFIMPIPQFYSKIKRYSFVIFYITFVLFTIGMTILAGVSSMSTIFYQELLSTKILTSILVVPFQLLVFLIPTCVLYCSINIYQLNKSEANKRFLIYSIANIAINLLYIMIVSSLGFEFFELLPINLNFWHFALIGILNTSMLIPYILMSHALIKNENISINTQLDCSEKPAELNSSNKEAK